MLHRREPLNTRPQRNPEFSLIDRIARHAGQRDGVALGIGDDAALLDPELFDGQQMVICTDTMVEGIHFLNDTAPRTLGHKSLAVNLSDLAAMGAEPLAATLSLTLPEADARWTEQFMGGWQALAEQHNLQLVGGDTTRGPLCIAVTAIGRVPPSQALLRQSAQAGDLILVTGTLGDAALALSRRLDGRSMDTELARRLDQPEPRVAFACRSRGSIRACIDVSDGLVADLNHLLAASQCGASIRVDELPLSEWLECLPDPQQACDLALTGGDDYELCLSCAPEEVAAVRQVAEALSLRLSCIGTVESEPGLRLLDVDGQPYHPHRGAYEHF